MPKHDGHGFNEAAAQDRGILSAFAQWAEEEGMLQ